MQAGLAGSNPAGSILFLFSKAQSVRVNREKLLSTLEFVSPGLAVKESISQSSCFVFHDGRVCTFNEEVFCTVSSPISGITGAVTAKQLLDLLSKLKEDDIDVEQRQGEILVKGSGRRGGVRMEAEVLLPVDQVELPTEWLKLESEFSDAIQAVYDCASQDQSEFVLTCVHVHPEHVEACDRQQVARYPIRTGVRSSTLVRAASISKMVPLGMIEISESPSWLHFRNAKGVVFSCRRFLDEYKEMGQFFLHPENERITLPGGLEEIIAKAEIFSTENKVGNVLTVEIRQDMISIKGEGASGWFEERKPLVYSGSPIKFDIAPRMLLAISKKSNDCYLRKHRLVVETGKLFFCVSTVVPETPIEKTA